MCRGIYESMKSVYQYLPFSRNSASRAKIAASALTDILSRDESNLVGLICASLQIDGSVQ